MILNKVIILILSVESFASCHININENKNDKNVLLSKNGIEEQSNNKMTGYKKYDDLFKATGRKKKKGGGGSNVNNVEIVTGGGGHGGYDHSEEGSYEVVQYKQKKNKGKKRKKGKKQKGYSKYVKSMTPVGLCVLALKLLFQHFFMKKLAALALASFLLSKTSFILSTLLALKQLFNSGGHEKSDSGGKLEVVHIPIRKKHPEFHDRDNDEGTKYIPITYPTDLYDQTTPKYIDYQYHNFENGDILKK